MTLFFIPSRHFFNRGHRRAQGHTVARNTLGSLVACGALLVLAGCTTMPEPEQEAPPVAARPAPAPRPVAAAPVSRPDPLASELRRIADMQTRLYDVSAPLLVNNAQLCRNYSRNLLGFIAKTEFSYGADFIRPAQSVLGLTGQLRITGVLKGSGAESAGARPGDVLINIGSKPIPGGADAERQAAFMLAPLMRTAAPIDLTVQRDNALVQLSIPLTPACGFGVELGNINTINSYADGRRVLVTAGMMNFAQTREELAYVIAREMAHDTLLHPARMRQTSLMSGIIDNLLRTRPDMSAINGTAAIRPYPQNMDLAADRLALYFVARAGYDIDGVAAFWQRVDREVPQRQSDGFTALHPYPAQRQAVINATVQEIKSKQQDNKPLMP